MYNVNGRRSDIEVVGHGARGSDSPASARLERRNFLLHMNNRTLGGSGTLGECGQEERRMRICGGHAKLKRRARIDHSAVRDLRVAGSNRGVDWTGGKGSWRRATV
jgi:hypothetical protein